MYYKEKNKSDSKREVPLKAYLYSKHNFQNIWRAQQPQDKRILLIAFSNLPAQPVHLTYISRYTTTALLGPAG